MLNDVVILLHGMGRSRLAMLGVSDFLDKNQYIAINKSYPSLTKTIVELAAEVLPEVIAEAESYQPRHIHFVTHSLGGIIVRQYLQEYRLPSGSRIVMIAPPNHGSEVIDHLEKLPFYEQVMAPAGKELSFKNNKIINELKQINYQVGVIAGNKSIEPWFAWMLPKPNDGKVSVASTKLSEMADHIVLPYSHPLIMREKIVWQQVLHFLQHGEFDHHYDPESE